MTTVNAQRVAGEITRFAADRLMNSMRDHGCDALVAAALPNVFYVTGYSSPSHRLMGRTPVLAILTKDGSRHLVIPSSDCDLAAAQTPLITSLHPYGSFFVSPPATRGELSHEDSILHDLLPSMRDGPSWLHALATVGTQLGLKRACLMLDTEGLTPAQLECIREEFPAATLRSGSEALSKSRSVKSPMEVELLRNASSITEMAITDALDQTRRGDTDWDLHRRFEIAVVERGGRPFFQWIGCGARTSMANGKPEGAPLQGDSIIRFDVGCKHMMYCSDIARNAVYGDVPLAIRSCYEAISAGHHKGLETIRPGVSASHLFEVIVDTVRANGLPHYERHHCGHGIGLEGYEPPLVSRGDTTVLEEGMVLCIETPYYQLGLGGVHLEDMVLVTGTGFELLTQLDRGILTL